MKKLAVYLTLMMSLSSPVWAQSMEPKSPVIMTSQRLTTHPIQMVIENDCEDNGNLKDPEGSTTKDVLAFFFVVSFISMVGATFALANAFTGL